MSSTTPGSPFYKAPDMASTLAFIAKLVDLANMAITIYQDATPFLDKIKAAATTPNWQPADADWAELDAMEAPLREALQAPEIT